MKNPAQELAALLANWAETTPWELEPRQVRWQARRYAEELLTEVDRSIKAMKMAGFEVDYFLTSYHKWHKAVGDLLAGRDLDRRASTSRDNTRELSQEFLEAADIRMLKALASHLDSVEVSIKSHEFDRQELVEILRDAEDAIAKAELPPDEFRYIKSLIDEARDTTLHVKMFGTSVYRKITAELGGELLRVVGQAPNPEQRSGLLRLVGRVLSIGVGSFTRKALETAGQDVAQEAMKALGSGSGN